MNLKEVLETISGEKLALIEGLNNELYLPLNAADLQKRLNVLNENSFELINLFCVEDFVENGFTLFYAFEVMGFEQILILQCPLSGNQAVSIAKTFPSACWYEREITDGFGIEFKGAFDKRRLFLHETYPSNFHPMLKSFKNGKIEASATNENDYLFKQVEGEGIYQIPVG
ncbi:MAG: NADH-quinone oxidoreductase subunit C, partial [Bacillota bacterium]